MYHLDQLQINSGIFDVQRKLSVRLEVRFVEALSYNPERNGFNLRWFNGCFNWPNHFSRSSTLGSTQSRTKQSARNLLGRGEGAKGGRSARKADNFTANCEPIAQKLRDPGGHNDCPQSEAYRPPSEFGFRSPKQGHRMWWLFMLMKQPNVATKWLAMLPNIGAVTDCSLENVDRISRFADSLSSLRPRTF